MTRTINTTLTAINENGIKVEGQDAWLNFSKFENVYADGLKPGDEVEVTLTESKKTGKEYITALRLIKAAEPTAEPQGSTKAESIIMQAAYKVAGAALSLDAYANPDAWESGKQRLHELAQEIADRIPREGK